MVVHAETDTYRFQKDRIRWAIGRASNPDLILPSDRFDVILDRDNTGLSDVLSLTEAAMVTASVCASVGRSECPAPVTRMSRFCIGTTPG